MKIAVVGGGPGGLFFAVLMKRANRSHEITVFERNAPDATFGFGVVFPERSLRYLRDADEETYQAFVGTSVNWDAIEYRHRGRVLRCGGHWFYGITRTDLLSLLQERARALGVDLRFEHEVSDLSSVMRHDLVVASDGINSIARRDLAEHFQPTIHVGRSKYIWLGTMKVFDALTFIFEDNEHGWFGIHAYPYSATASTVIVETDEESWRRAGLDRSSAAALAPGESDLPSVEYCERLFAGHLEDHRLLANNSKWQNFRTVRNRFWRARNVVLLGDAAHTAHFSVGSGTRMAMEDAIALASALNDHTDLAAALLAYEHERRPAVRRIQRAAEPSRRWWENFRHWAPLAPEQFACHHLARTRLITYGTLKVRDPAFVKGAETWFATTINVPASGQGTSPLLAPLALRDVVLANRVVVPPEHEPASGDEVVGRSRLEKVAEDARTGAGLILTAPTPISADAHDRTPLHGLWTREHADAWRRVIESIHAQTAARVGLHLGDVLLGGAHGDRLRYDLVHAAQLGSQALFDLLELRYAADASEGEDSIAFALDLFEAVRSVWPGDRPICAHLEAWEDPEDDQAVEAGLHLARSLASRACDLVAISVPRQLARIDPERAHVAQVFTSELIRTVVGLPTMLVGGSYSVGEVNALILAGRADLCEWPQLAWPGWRPTEQSPRVIS